MRAKCKKCGDTVEVTKPGEYKSCKCGAIALDYGDPPYYFRVVGNLENFDGEIEDAPKIRDLSNPNRYKVKSRQMGKAAKISESHEKKITPIMWGNSTDQSTCGIVLVDNGYNKRVFFGSRERYTNEENDAQYIADYGNEITRADLKQLLKMIGE